MALFSPGTPGEYPSPGTLTPTLATGEPEPRAVQVGMCNQGVKGTSEFKTYYKKKLWDSSLIIFKIGYTSQSS